MELRPHDGHLAGQDSDARSFSKMPISSALQCGQSAIGLITVKLGRRLRCSTVSTRWPFADIKLLQQLTRIISIVEPLRILPRLLLGNSASVITSSFGHLAKITQTRHQRNFRHPWPLRWILPLLSAFVDHRTRAFHYSQICSPVAE